MATKKKAPAEAADTGSENQNAPQETKSKKQSGHYECWLCTIKNGKADKVKIVKGRVLISDEQAAVLNEGRLNGGNNMAELYFKPE